MKREIGPFSSAMLVLNGAIGAGIFALPATLYADFGSSSPWLFPAFGALVFLIAIPLADLARRFDGAGGPVAYTREAFGGFVAFEVGWAYYISRMAAMAANATVFATYAASLHAPLGEGLPRAALIALLVAAVTAANVVGVRRAASALDALSVLKIAPLLLVAGLGLAAGLADGGLAAPALPGPDAVGPAALLVLYAFIGFEAALIPASETREPHRTIPRALLATLGGTTLLYFLVQSAYVATMAGETPQAAPLVAMAEKLMGPLGAGLMIFAALFSIAGNLQSIMLAVPRVSFALGEAGALPRWFAAVSPRFATPVNSIVFLGAGALLLALSGSFVWLAVVSTLARLFVYAASLAALPVIRARRGEAPRRGLAGIVFTLIFWSGAAFVLWAIFQSKPEAFRTLLVLLFAGAALFGLALVSRRKPE